jgi:hypothetical protein
MRFVILIILLCVQGCATLKDARPYEAAGAALETAYLETGKAKLRALPPQPLGFKLRQAALAEHRARWAPVWPAWRAVVDAHDLAVSEDSADLFVLNTAWCDLVAILATVPDAPALPKLFTCEVAP